MVRALAIETSSRIGSVALVQDGRSVAQETFAHGLQHAARMVPAIDGLCRRAGWRAEELREIYVSAGPGSFTGLRIGITLAKTLAFVTGAMVVAVSTADVLVENLPADVQQAIVVIDAKREQIFTALFARADARWRATAAPHLGSLTEMLGRASRPVHLIGEGLPYHAKCVAASDAGVHFTPAGLWRPRAEMVARLGWEMARRGEFVDPLKLSPIYIRRPEAEEKLDAKTGQFPSPPAISR